MLTRASVFAVVVGLACLSPGSAGAGPWTRAVGDGFTSQETRYFRTEGAADERFEQIAVSVYAEYGLIEDLTVGLKLEQGQRLDISGGGSQSGRIGGFVRIGVWQGEAGDVAAVEVGASMPLGGFQSAAAPTGDEAEEYRGSVLYGRGIESDYGAGWADGALGFAYFTGGRASEIKLDLTLGLRPNDEWVGLAQVFGTLSLRNAAETDFDLAKVKFSVGRKMFEDKTILIGLARDVYTRGTSPGWEASLTIWSPFDFDFSE